MEETDKTIINPGIILPDKTGDNREYKVGDKHPPKENQFKPGEVHNPKGRPKNIKYISDIIRELLEKDSGEGKTNAELIAEALIKLAGDTKQKGNIPALKELLERIEGRVPYAVDHSLQGSEALEELLGRLRGKKDA